MTYRPRHLRSAVRGLRASDQARNAGKSALDCALIDIHTRFDRADRINRFKLRVEVALRRGSASEEVRCWYAMITSLLRRANVRTHNRAIQIIVAEMIRTIMIERETGMPRLLIRHETLDEAVLALRWLRRYRPDMDVRALIENMARGPERKPTVHLVAAG